MNNGPLRNNLIYMVYISSNVPLIISCTVIAQHKNMTDFVEARRSIILKNINYEIKGETLTQHVFYSVSTISEYLKKALKRGLHKNPCTILQICQYIPSSKSQKVFSFDRTISLYFDAKLPRKGTSFFYICHNNCHNK